MAKIRTEIDGEVIDVEAETIEEAYQLLCMARPVRTDVTIRPIKKTQPPKPPKPEITRIREGVDLPTKPLLRYHFADVNGVIPEVIVVAATDYDAAIGVAEEEAKSHGVDPGRFFESWDCGNKSGIAMREGVLSDGRPSLHYRARNEGKP